MTIKPVEIIEIHIHEASETFRDAVSKELIENDDYKLIEVRKQVTYPYKDVSKEMVSYSAYIVYYNLMIVMTQYDYSERVSKDTMVVGDCIKFAQYWENSFSSVPVEEKEPVLNFAEGMVLMRNELERMELSYDEYPKTLDYMVTYVCSCSEHDLELTATRIKKACAEAVEFIKKYQRKI